MAQYLACSAPEEDSEAYTVPSSDLLSAWKTAVGDMLSGGDCSSISLPTILTDASYEIGVLTDGGVDFCVLASFQTDSNDWYSAFPYGAVVVNQDPNAKDLSIDIPHPIYDDQTFRQGIAVFKGTDARSFTLSGSHRKANAAISCQGSSYKIADAAHNSDHTFQMSAVAIKEYYAALGKDFTSIQFHGMGSTCPDDDVFMTHGFKTSPQAGEKIQLLRDAFKNELEDVADQDRISMTGDTDCTLTGTSNTQGRFYNGVDLDDVCTTAQVGYSGNFIHIEQQRFIRISTAYDQKWINALNAVNFAVAAPPIEPVAAVPKLKLTSFDEGGIMYKADDIVITWESENLPDDEIVKLSVHHADKTWLTNIVKATANDGSYTWKVTNSLPETEDLILRVRSETTDKRILDYTASFRVANRIDITSDNGGSYQSGDEITVTWNVVDIPNVKIDIFQVVDEDYNMFQMLIRVRNTEDTSCRDYTSYFTVLEGGAPDPSLTLTSFNGGQILTRSATNIEFTWDSQGMQESDTVQLAFMRNDEPKRFNNYIVTETPNTGSYILPKLESWIRAGDDILVRIRSTDDTSIKAYSEEPITIEGITIQSPAGGESFSAGDEVAIEWSSIEMTGNLYLALMKGTSWKKTIVKTLPITAATGEYHWTIPDGLEDGSDYNIRIRSVEDTSIREYTDEFSITAS
ncbi:Inherit from COG: chitinase [Seminavis robusta]|uniref:Inherit from COG: chitinase n=1 Tax=Seminavis robusta TaxID=568900 RepID=A0A9N8DLN0_9STRA|nr:Inherit from COG: chitinase [Seminavis robusta]|eukprot:Sro211_g087800.1 Inherit from COG: chitinase (687) ;mRNA; r:1338-3475